MKSMLVEFVLGLALAMSVGVSSAWAGDPADRYPDLHLIPWPKQVAREEGRLPLTSESRVIATDSRLLPLAEILSDELRVLTGFPWREGAEPAQPGDIVLRIDPAIRAGEPILTLRDRQPTRLTDGAHRIQIDQIALVSGFDYRATAEGASTILQLLAQANEEFSLPKVSIHDWPHADYCGVMLDVARQDHPPEAIRQVIRLCRLYKARYLHLHLTDDQGWTFPSTKYPSLGAKNYGAHGGVAPRVYKLDELRELVEFADARGVTLVPEVEMPGHCAAALRSLPEVFDAIDPDSRAPVGMGCMNMSNEALYPALDTIIGEICDVFRSSPYFHIGSDEVSSGRLALHPGYREFMRRHSLANDEQLAEHFIAAACEMVKRHGKKAIKWEGLANGASKDVIIMTWEGNSNSAAEWTSRGWTTITCPWNLGVPWEEWSMYRCNASQLERGSSVLGATLVAWEQPPSFHIASLRALPARQERTWGPDNQVTVTGFAARFQPLDALAGKILDLPPRASAPATFSTSLGFRDFCEPVFAFDGSDETFYRSAGVPRQGDRFEIELAEPVELERIEVLTGANGQGLFDGAALQVSADGAEFETAANLSNGTARATLDGRTVKSIRLLAEQDAEGPVAIREIRLRSRVAVSGPVVDPTATVGSGNVARVVGDAVFSRLGDSCSTSVIHSGGRLRIELGGSSSSYLGAITGSGSVEIHAGGPDPARMDSFLNLAGDASNELSGSWNMVAGRVALAKSAGANALRGVIEVSGREGPAELVWQASDQIRDDAELRILQAPRGENRLKLNGFHEIASRLTIDEGGKIETDGPLGGGYLVVGEASFAGVSLPRGLYAAPAPWIEGAGYVVVGPHNRVDISGEVRLPLEAIRATDIGLTTASTELVFAAGDSPIAIETGAFPLTLRSKDPGARHLGFITGLGSVSIDAPTSRDGESTFEIAGKSSNSYSGPTTIVRGVVELNKSKAALALPGDVTIAPDGDGASAAGLRWGADGQLGARAVVAIAGERPAFLDLAGHHAKLGKITLSSAGRIRLGRGGTIAVEQLWVAGERVTDGVVEAPAPWLEGEGRIVIDSRIDVSGTLANPDAVVGAGNIARMTADTKIGYPANGFSIEIANDGHVLTLDSGDGNPFVCSGVIKGVGQVEFFMGPSYTGYKDAPLRITGERPNTMSGSFFVRKGRVQLEKPAGVDAISGDVFVGGQGFNDGLFWVNDEQLNDSVRITLLDAGKSGAAYLALNGRRETAAGLTLTSRNRVRTDSEEGVGGVLITRSLILDGKPQPPAEYASANAPWIEGSGKVIVRP